MLGFAIRVTHTHAHTRVRTRTHTHTRTHLGCKKGEASSSYLTKVHNYACAQKL